jgi:hypothetical protein
MSYQYKANEVSQTEQSQTVSSAQIEASRQGTLGMFPAPSVYEQE